VEVGNGKMVAIAVKYDSKKTQAREKSEKNDHSS
jgi:hypothetical protein